MGNTFGTLLRLTSFGESHGVAVGGIVDGCPAGIALDASILQAALDRRRPGQSKLVTQRKEPDSVEIISGVDSGVTLGTPIAFAVRNVDAKAKDYREMTQAFRPSHADYTYYAKFGVSAGSGGGRSSARETIARVAAGAIAEQILNSFGVTIVAWVDQISTVVANIDGATISRRDVDIDPTRCPDLAAAAVMTSCIEAARKAGDSVGGAIRAVARGVPVGWGEPVFDKLEADIGKAMLSIPAVKGFEIGSGFHSITMTGSTHNDAIFKADDGRIRTKTNHAGGVVGGISNGEDINIRVAFKPTATIMQTQQTVTKQGDATDLAGRGRHDPCVLPRAVPIVESMMALVLADHALRHRARRDWP
jgi:chorismate synthase